MLIAAGDRYDRLVSWGAVTTSNDGITWTTPTEPFPFRAKIVSITHGPDLVVAASDAGWVATTSTNLDTWQWERVWDGTFSPQAVAYSTDLQGNNGIYLMAGQEKFGIAQGDYEFNDEIACIFSNVTGRDSDWAMMYVHEEINSRFYNIKRISNTTIDAWFAVGAVGDRPMALYTTDGGVNWQAVPFPNLASIKYAYDVVFNDGRFWFTTHGIILNTASLVDPDWDASPVIAPQYGSADLRRIAVNPAGHMVAACSGGLVYSTDKAGWTIFSAPGYRFRSIVWFVDKWVASAESNLTTYTYWTSNDTVNWTPDNNAVQAYDFVTV